MSFFGKRKPVARRFALLYYEFSITTYTFRYARLAPTDLVFFRRTAIISRTGNHRTTPIPAAIAIATGIGPTIVPTARLRRFRITRLAQAQGYWAVPVLGQAVQEPEQRAPDCWAVPA